MGNRVTGGVHTRAHSKHYVAGLRLDQGLCSMAGYHPGEMQSDLPEIRILDKDRRLWACGPRSTDPGTRGQEEPSQLELGDRPSRGPWAHT